LRERWSIKDDSLMYTGEHITAIKEILSSNFKGNRKLGFHIKDLLRIYEI
jgi:hypothetical protein